MSTTIVPTPVVQSVTPAAKSYEYLGFKVFVHELNLYTSVGLRVCVAYLLNGSMDPECFLNDGTYSYVKKYVVLTGDDYNNWANDDSYINTWVANNFETVINSPLEVPFLRLRPDQF